MKLQQLMAIISPQHFEHPSVIRKRAKLKSVNSMLGRMVRLGMVERVPSKRANLYRSRQGKLL